MYLRLVRFNCGPGWRAVAEKIGEELSASEEQFLRQARTLYEQRLEAGVARDRLILDPGMGFFLGDSPEPSLVVLGNIQHAAVTAIAQRHDHEVFLHQRESRRCIGPGVDAIPGQIEMGDPVFAQVG